MKSDQQIRWLLLCGAIGCFLFTAIVITEGAVRPDYNAAIYPLSSLSLGDRGWIQITNFIVSGLFLLFFSHGVRKQFNSNRVRSSVPVLIALAGGGVMGAGFFRTDPLYGYPADEPFRISQFTVQGHLHDLFSMLVFICVPWACFLMSKYFKERRERRLFVYSLFSAVIMMIAFVLSAISFKQVCFIEFGGVFQRVSVFGGWLWLTVLSFHLWRKSKQE